MMTPKQLLPLLMLFAIFQGGLSQASEEATPEVWTPRKAVDFALRNSPDSQIAAQRMIEAKALQTKSAASFYPTVNLSGSYGQTNNPMYSFGNILNQGAFTPTIDFNAPGRTDNLNLTAAVQYRFYNGGQDLARNQAAAAGVDVSVADREAILLRLEFEAFRSFQKIEEAELILKASEEGVTAIRSSLQVARTRYDAGDLLRSDLLNLEVQESRAVQNQIRAAHNLELSKKIFLQLLGLPSGEVNIDTVGTQTPLRPERLDSELRPEIQRLLSATRAAEAQLKGARGEWLPTVDGFAAYQYDQGTVMDGSGDSWLAGIKVNFNLFDGGNSSADVAVAKAKLNSLRAEKKKLGLAINLEIVQSELALSEAEQSLQVTQKMVDLATESEALSQARFKEGVILVSDLINSENSLTDARVRNATATSALRIAIADLRRASGLSQFNNQFKTPLPLESQQ